MGCVPVEAHANIGLLGGAWWGFQVSRVNLVKLE